MLATSKLMSVMKTMLNDGVEGASLMTSDGAVLCSVSLSERVVTETGLAAISSSIWSNYSQGGLAVSFHMLKLDNGILGIVPTGKGYILVAYGTEVTCGLLRGKLEALSAYFTRVFLQVQE